MDNPGPMSCLGGREDRGERVEGYLQNCSAAQNAKRKLRQDCGQRGRMWKP